MGRWGILQGKKDNLVKDLKETTLSFEKLGERYGVSRQAIHGFCRTQDIKRPLNHRGHQTGECRLCQKLIQISKKPQSEFISVHTIVNETEESKAKYLYHLQRLRDKGLVDEKFGRLLSKNRIADEVFKEIFPKKLSRSQSSEQVYAQLKKMILSGKLKKGKKLAKEEIAHTFNVSRTPVTTAYSQLEKDGLIIIRGRGVSFVNNVLKNPDKKLTPEKNM
jgi:DNA-binding transcriptional regulator YhcF (GntR family)